MTNVNYTGQGIERTDTEQAFEDQLFISKYFELAALIPNTTPLRKDGELVGVITKNERPLHESHPWGVDFFVLATHQVPNFEGSKGTHTETYHYETEISKNDKQTLELYTEAWKNAIADLGVDDEQIEETKLGVENEEA